MLSAHKAKDIPPVNAHHTDAADSLLKAAKATHVAVRDGNWSDPDTWQGGRVPDAGSLIHIPSDVSITYDVKTSPAFGTLRLDGTLSWTHAHDTEMLIETVVTSAGSLLEIGTADDPLPAHITADVVFRDTPLNMKADPALLSHGLVAHGKVSIEGAEKESFLTLEDAARAGDTKITAEGDLGNWTVGDTILIVGTKYVGEDRNGVLQTQDEERTIVAIDGDTITFDRPLDHDHTTPSGMKVDTYVGNLSRNVTFSSENPEGTRGHFMMHNGESDGAGDPANSVRYAAFDEMGRTDKSQDISASNPEGRYPLHLHMTGEGVGVSTSVLEGNAVTGGPGWGIVQHSSRALINDNIVFDITGGGIVSETGNETGAWMRNLVSSVTGYDEPNKNGDGNQGAAYENQSRVIVQQDNIAANSKLGWNFSGQEDFAEDQNRNGAPRDGAHRKMFEREQVKFDPSPFDVALDHEEPPIVDFTGNTVIGSEEAFRVYHRQFSDDTDTMSVIRDFTVWGGQNGVNLKNYSSNYEFIDSTIQGSGEGFRVERKTSAVVFNDVEFRDFGTGWHSYGVNHESFLVDVDFVNVRNEFKIEDLMVNIKSGAQKQKLVDYYREKYGIDYNNPKPGVIDSSKLKKVDKVTFVADRDADLKVGAGDSRLEIKGKIYDSLGERTFNEYVVAKTPAGNTGSKEFDGIDLRFGSKAAGLQIDYTFDEFLAVHGTFQKADGTWVSPVVNWITDRLTAEQHPVIIEIELVGLDRQKLQEYRLDSYPNPGIDNKGFDYGFGDLGADKPGHDKGDHDDGGHNSGGHDGGKDEGEGQMPDPKPQPVPEPEPKPEPKPQPEPIPEPEPEPAPTPGKTPMPMPDGDVVRGNGTLRGSDNGDLLEGGSRKDVLYGNDGDDTLIGNAGANKLYGGEGADRFVFNDASLDGIRDDVKDFDVSEGDMLVFQGIVPGAHGDLNDWLRIEKSGTLGILQYDETGTGKSFEDIAVIRDGRGLTIESLIGSDSIDIL